jgi:uncharacterized protein (TIGR02145 family)
MKTTKLTTYFLLVVIALTSIVCNACKEETPKPTPIIAVESISVEPMFSIVVGSSKILTAIVKPDNATNKVVIWTSSNANATVDDNGKVTAVKVGEAIITATAGGKIATCTITITEDITQNPVTDITLNKDNLELMLGEFETLTATVLPDSATNKTVTWSSNSASATVDANGTVTAVSAGSAIITATAGGKTATCTVVVKTIPTEGVLINGVVWAKYNVDEPGVFAATPESAGQFYQWGKNTTDWDRSYSYSATTWEKANDPSPTGWRVPTSAEIVSLHDETKVTSEWIIQNGVKGRKYTDIGSGNSIFFCAAGCLLWSNGEGSYKTEDGFYWSSTRANSNDAYVLQFVQWNSSRNYYNRKSGYSIRPVAE